MSSEWLGDTLQAGAERKLTYYIDAGARSVDRIGVSSEFPVVRFKSWVVDRDDFILELFGIELGPWRARVYMKDTDKLVPIWSIGPVRYAKAWRDGMEMLDGLMEARTAA